MPQQPGTAVALKYKLQTAPTWTNGTLINGTEFDSSFKRGEPAVFGLAQVIPGWSEGLQLMSPEDKDAALFPTTFGGRWFFKT